MLTVNLSLFMKFKTMAAINLKSLLTKGTADKRIPEREVIQKIFIRSSVPATKTNSLLHILLNYFILFIDFF